MKKDSRVASAGAFLVGLCFPAFACAPVPPMGATVSIANEEAIIVWDSSSKTQHFIRRAAFDTSAKDFGFLVPTPTQPQLAEADSEAFASLARLTAPEIRRMPRDAKSEARKAAPATAAAPVTVLERKKVAGLDAAVLEATDAEALDGWLKKNGYVSGPELIDWYKPYITDGWKITAFKIDSESSRASSAAVRMSFRTETPFFPYREPASQRTEQTKGKDRMLRVYLLANERFSGAVGKAGKWPGETVWSERIAAGELQGILKLVKLGEATALDALWLTEFEDRASPRPGTDELFFSRASDQSVVKRSPIYVSDNGHGSGWSSFIGISIVAVIFAGLLWLAFIVLRWIYRKVAR